MEFIDYYQTLGLTSSATADDIKKAYRKLARKYHPDVNPGDADAQRKFQQINEANEVLSDPENRKKYDQYGKDWKHADAFEQARQQRGSAQSEGGFGSFGGGFPGGDFGGGEEGFSDFFESLFGGSARGGGRSARYRGQDYQAELRLPLRQAATTHPQTLSVNGKNIRITVPAGIADGQKIRLAGQGAPGANGGPAGDLFITFAITPDPQFRRLGDDLHTDAAVSLYTAVLGGDATVETLDGKIRLKIAPGTQPGSKVRVKGKGFPVYKQDANKGDLFVTVQVDIPTSLSDREKELFTELSKMR